jgi:hypothetical protein
MVRGLAIRITQNASRLSTGVEQMSAIGAVGGAHNYPVQQAQAAQATQQAQAHPVDSDGDHDNNAPDGVSAPKASGGRLDVLA